MPRKAKSKTEKKVETEIKKSTGKKKHKVRPAAYSLYIQRIGHDVDKDTEGAQLSKEIFPVMGDIMDFLLDKLMGNILIADYPKTISTKMVQASVAMYANSRGVPKDGTKDWLAYANNAVEKFESS